jgi:hypothetical protein
VAAKAVIVAEVERLHWRIWNGKAKNAQISINRIRAVMHHFEREPGTRQSIAPSRKLWTALRALDSYLTGQNDWLVNYAERHRAGLRVGSLFNWVDVWSSKGPDVQRPKGLDKGHKPKQNILVPV